MILNQCRFVWEILLNAFDKAPSLSTTNIVEKVGGRLLGNINTHFQEFFRFFFIDNEGIV